MSPDNAAGFFTHFKYCLIFLIVFSFSLPFLFLACWLHKSVLFNFHIWLGLGVGGPLDTCALQWQAEGRKFQLDQGGWRPQGEVPITVTGDTAPRSYPHPCPGAQV